MLTLMPSENSSSAGARQRRGGENNSRHRKRKLFHGARLVPCCFCECALSFKLATVEHIVPVSRGGTSDLHNLAISCSRCNTERGTQPFWTYWLRHHSQLELFNNEANRVRKATAR